MIKELGQLTSEKVMTVKEIAEVLNVSKELITQKVKEFFPDKVRNGYTTYLNEKEVTYLKMNLVKKYEVQTELEKDLIIIQAMTILNDRIKTLTEQKEKAESQVKMLVHDFKKTYTTTEIAKELNLKSAQQLNDLLANKKIQYKNNGTWVLFSDYSDKNYTSIKETVLDSGKIVYDRLWTGHGRQFIINLLEVK